MSRLNDTEAAEIGQRLRNEDNLLIGSFAAELVGESYPFDKEQQAIVFEAWSDKDLGYRFAKWMDEAKDV